jgi:hypothetical protein
MIGGMGKRVVERVLEFGDGWLPQPGRATDDDSFIERLGELTQHGRNLPMTAFGAKPDPAAIERYEQAGVSRTVFWVPPAERDEAERYLDRLVESLGAQMA